MIENEYGEQYILIDGGDTFAGNWVQINVCFGITEDTLEAWCKGNNSTYSIKKYDAGDELYNSLWHLYKILNEPKVPPYSMGQQNSGASADFNAGLDAGTKHAADAIKSLMQVFDAYTYRPAQEINDDNITSTVHKN